MAVATPRSRPRRPHQLWRPRDPLLPQARIQPSEPENVEKLEALRVDPMADVAVEEPTSERVTTAAGPFMGEHKRPVPSA